MTTIHAGSLRMRDPIQVGLQISYRVQTFPTYDGAAGAVTRSKRTSIPMAASGRNGQIRTADLPLRRRPLYPAELRPHSGWSHSILNAGGDEPLAYVGPELHSFKPNMAHSSIGSSNGFFQTTARGCYAEYSPSRSFEPAIGQARTRMEYFCLGALCLFNSGD